MTIFCPNLKHIKKTKFIEIKQLMKMFKMGNTAIVHTVIDQTFKGIKLLLKQYKEF